MTRRKKSLAKLKKLGFKVAPSLPAGGSGRVRPATEIAARFVALRELFLWVASERPLKRTNVKRALTPDERKARSASLGGKTVPKGFHPIAGTGVIHERRHALTWATSPRVKWDDTDLST